MQNLQRPRLSKEHLNFWFNAMASRGSDGLKSHRDNGFLTIVKDDGILSVLEVMEKSGKFVAIDPCPGTLLVTLGDIARVWSNGRFYNVKHRVVCKEAGMRMSIVTFLLGGRDTMVETPPELVDSEHPRSDGLKSHRDNGFLTIVQDDGIHSVLEVMEKSGKFVATDPCPGALLVTLGDIARVWSNRRFYNVKHRVVCKEAGMRMSIATFLLGARDTMVETPPELVDFEHPRLYVPFNC
ncbi:2-oxoglutarate-dependent dioxygenase DAO-like [Olea europaea subsp. europaea]|uniref:2-oxoglutarate-dependent dioxygenase DAO-like n=1 Tax=Olea europaea subsp. europaea TaxID=158383 RepID=A0A8S0SWQ6_OLEEU|nr:2-oxoglutarate-dependent dioxygenase DAO-like [Olea europaea subsp. europaea]